ncbi:MAG: adenylate/guanylate cyclase domain-containing protein [Treponema sp.]|nr:adenylate/guanylate cyclase domain-containing protein [Treponema sp.]
MSSKNDSESPYKVRAFKSIGFKLVLIITVLVILSLGSLTFVVSYFSSNDVRVTTEENNLTINTRSAATVENEIDTVRSSVSLLMDLLSNASSNPAYAHQASALYFERNQHTAAIIVTGETPSRFDRKLINTRFFVSNELEVSCVDTFLEQKKSELLEAAKGQTMILNAAPVFNLPVLVFLYPWAENGIEQTLAIFFSAENMTEVLGSGTTNQSFIVNHENDLLIHSDFSMVKACANFSSNPLIQEMRNNNDTNRQILYTDPEDGRKYFGAYRKLSVSDLGIFTIVPYDIVLEPVFSTIYRNVFLTLIVLFLAILFIWFYSKTISNPLRILTKAVTNIKQGKFQEALEYQIKKVKENEIGVLNNGVKDMSKALITFSKFTNKTIAFKAINGDMQLGGETREATIFFSDIRSFTAISEKLTPAEVVDFLNVYMTRMVDCVNKTNGNVDKFIGDAIMALWGVPNSSGSAKQDALNAVRAALMMRHSLHEFNEGRGGDKKPIIRIGCGINSGPVVAGQMGSTERMEYTCIGDAVNFASRTEALNKPLHTDILITENTYELIKEYVIVEQQPSVTVKGKEKPVKLFAVVNMPDAIDIPGAGAKGPKTMAEVRDFLGIDPPEMAKVDLNAEEKKYKIQ